MLLVVLQFAVHDAMVTTMQAVRNNQTPGMLDYLLSNVHLLGGIVIFLLMCWRLVLRVKEGVPAALTDYPKLLSLLARLNHWLLYTLLLGLPVTGMLAYYELASWARVFHAAGKPLLLGFTALHVAAAIYHWAWRRDQVVQRMLPISRERLDQADSATGEPVDRQAEEEPNQRS